MVTVVFSNRIYLLINLIAYVHGYYHGRFETGFQWNYLNYTWISSDQYLYAVLNEEYIPENNAFTGIKIYDRKIYLSVPRYRNGIPSTLNYIHQNDIWHNPLLVPFPSWEANREGNCNSFQSVQSMEIDTKGVMWVIDGARINNFNKCPTKLVLLDLNQDGIPIQTHVFPNHISLQDGGFLNDIVIDETEDGFAYITDTSPIDPGLVVYSRKQDRAWKLRDRSMFPEPVAKNFVVENTVIRVNVPIDGIALSPKKGGTDRTLFYSSLIGYKLNAIKTSFLKNEQELKSGDWRQNIWTVGYKVGQSDGLMIDNAGNLFFTLLPQYGVGRWNTKSKFSSSKIIDVNKKELIWPDTFAMDQEGFLYVNSNRIYKYIDPNTTLSSLNNDIEFRILRYYTGTRSYLYS